MSRQTLAASLVPALLLPAYIVAWAPPSAAQQVPFSEDAAWETDAQQEVGESPERYAQVKVVEGNVTIRKGETPEALTRGLPVAEGDVVESQGRGVLQLGDGTAIAFGTDTRFRVAALFSDLDAVRRVLLVLERGSLRVCRGPQSDAQIRVDTPSGSGTLGSPGVAAAQPEATLHAFPDPKGPRAELMVHLGQATFSNARQQIQVFAGERLTAYGNEDPLDRLADFNAFSVDEFDQWAESRVRPRTGASATRVPPEIQYYVDDLDANGRWVYVDDASGWCWTPTGVAEDWRPYSDGYWGDYAGGMTWVSSEAWGYVTCHHGRWGWGERLGWYWIPGIYYSPAWVAWNCSGGYFGWAPLGFYNRPCKWGYGPWAGGLCWNAVRLDGIHGPILRGRLSKDPGILRTLGIPGPGARPWSRSRLVVTREEFHDPARFQRLVTQPALLRERVATYVRTSEAATGRTILRPQPVPMEPQYLGFTHRERPANAPARPITHRPGEGSERHEVRTTSGQEPRQPRTPRDERPRPEENRSTPSVIRSAPAETHSAPEAAPRREQPRTDRTEPPRPERHEAPRQEHYEPPRQEHHEAAPRPEVHPAPSRPPETHSTEKTAKTT